MLPLNVNEVKGYWLDQPTFDFTGFKLSVAVGCEYQLVEERKYRTSIEADRDSEKKAKDTAIQNYKSLVERSEKEKETTKVIIQGLNDDLLKQSNKHLKGTLRFGVLSLGIAGTIWALTKKGVL